MESDKLKSLRGDAQRRVDEVCRLILDGQNSLTEILVKAFREGHSPEAGRAVFEAIKACAEDARITYNAAIVQPVPRVSSVSRVVL